MTGAARTAPRTILFVEDEVLIAMLASAMISDFGYQVIEANSGAKAVEILSGRAAVDLLITDYSMPRMNGVELVKAARSLRPDLPVLIATGHAALPEGLEPGLPHLSKPYSPAQLRLEIEKLLGKA